MYQLKGSIQHYAWGGFDYIPQLLNISNNQHLPFAEYWMGAHESKPSLAEINGHSYPLNDLIKQDPVKWLGEKTANRFGRLPYLFKVLDVKDMLSIQVHPTKEEAEKGFAFENKSGIPLNAPNRNYKDDNHKPEVMVALSEFWLLHGFKNKIALINTLQETSQLSHLLAIFNNGDYKELYKHVMELSQEEVNTILNPLLVELYPLYAKNKLDKTNPGYWACKAADTYKNEENNIDRGIFSIYFFNILYLTPGQGIFQGAGIPHAYMEGQNIELMANSDNVLRGGLTPKYVDVPELIKHTSFTGVDASVMEGDKKGTETVYSCPVADFTLSRIVIENNSFSNTAASAEITIITEGNLEITCGDALLQLKRGDSFITLPGEQYHIKGNAVLFKATTP